MSTPVVRRAAPADAPLLVANNLAMAHETEGLTLDLATLERGTRAVLDDPRLGFYLVADLGGRVVGQLMVTFEWSDWRNRTFWWLQSVYVSPEARRSGVFRALYAHLLALARQADAAGLRLYVERHNERALATYLALGMRRTEYEMLEVDFVLTR